MTKGRLLRSTLAILAIFFCIQGFNIFLSAKTLDGMISSSVLSGYRSVVSQLVTTVERGLRFGKKLDGFAGMNAYMSNTTGSISGIEQIAVMDTGGKVLYSNTPIHDVVPYKGALDDFIKLNSTSAQWVDHQNGYYDVHPLYGARDSLHGYLVLKPDPASIESAREGFLKINAVIVIVLALTVAIAQTGWMSFIMATARERDSKRMKRNIRWLLLLIIGGAQLLYSIPTLYFFSVELEHSAEYKAELLGTPFVRDLEFLVQKNVDLAKIGGIEDYLDTIVNDSPEISSAKFEFHDETVAQAGTASHEEMVVTVPLYKSWPDRYTPRAIVGRLTLTGNKTFVTDTLKKLALDLGTTLIICLILLGELANLFATLMGVRDTEDQEPQLASQWDTATLVRGMSFLFFFGYDMVLTFIPQAASSLSGQLFNLSPSVLSSLPISAEMAMAGVGVFLVGTLSRRMRWHLLFFAGVGCAVIGGVMAWSATSIGFFTLSRSLSGLGFGLALMSGQVGLLGEANRAEGIGNMFAGIFAGSLSGCAAGAMVAEHFGYPVVFLIAGILILLSLVFLPILQKMDIPLPSRSKRRAGTFMAFLKEPGLWLALILISLPSAACLSGFLFFIVPVQMKALDIAQGDIGRVFMIYGLCFIYAGPLIGKIVDRTNRPVLYLALAGILSGAALLFASQFPSLWGFATSVLFTGIAQCILASCLLVYILALPAVQALGSEHAASVFRFMERAGQVVGPILFAGLLSTIDFNMSLLVVGAIIASAAAVFAALTSKKQIA